MREEMALGGHADWEELSCCCAWLLLMIFGDSASFFSFLLVDVVQVLRGNKKINLD